MNLSRLVVLYEEKDFLIIDKQPGTLSHRTAVDDTRENISDLIIEMYPDIIGVGEDLILQNKEIIKRPGIVHRLDKETSGVMVIPRNQPFFLFLKSKFKEREVIKEYHAFVEGVLKYKRGTMETQYGRSKNDFRKYNTSRTIGKVRQAITEYAVKSETKNTSFIAMFPKTGRTHQLRVHTRNIGHAIIADSLYGRKRRSVP